MKQLNRIIAVSLVVLATIVGITYTTNKSSKMKLSHQPLQHSQQSLNSVWH